MDGVIDGSGIWRSFEILEQAYLMLPSGLPTTADVYRYEPVSDTWFSDLSFPGTLVVHPHTFTINDVGYVCGGTEPGGQSSMQLWSTEGGQVGVDEVDSGAPFTAFWNATTNQLEVSSTDRTSFTVKLYDVQGRLLHNEASEGSRLQIAINSVSTQVVFADISNDSGVLRQKVLVR